MKRTVKPATIPSTLASSLPAPGTLRPETFAAPTLTRAVDFDPFTGPSIERTAPTTETQREIWTAAQMGPEASCAYNESVSLELRGALDRNALLSSLAQLSERHEAMRSVLSASGTRNIILTQVELPVNEIDLASFPSNEQEARLQELGHADMSTPFDLKNGPLFRFALVRLAPTQHLLRITGHHLVCDGWSLGILMADLSALYSAICQGRPAELPPAYRYSDHALAQIDLLKSDAYAAVEQYWLAQFKGGAPRVDLPTDRPRPRVKTYSGDRLDASLDLAMVTALRQVGTRAGSSLVTTLLTAFELLLHRLTGATDLVVGLPAAGQSDMGTKELVGHCVNLLALRSRLDPQRSFLDHLRERRSAVLDAFDHQRYTFGTLLRKLNVPREAGRIPLVPVVFNIDMNMDDGVAFDGLTHRFISNPRAFENFELFLNATGNDRHLTLEWSYNTDLFDRATVQDWMRQFEGLLQRICDFPERPMAELLRAPVTTAQQGLPPQEWSWNTSDYPRDTSIGTLFDEIAAQHPKRTALRLGDEHLTYAALQDRVHTLAAQLREEGIAPGEPVGLCVERSFDMVTAMLAILRCGGAFVPFDPSYPAERLSFMFEDTQCRILLTQRTLKDALPMHNARVIFLDDARRSAGSPSDPQGTATSPAYIMYTSGSTGTPKGVVVPHRAVVRLVREQNFLPFGPDQVFLQLSNISFDASTLEIWGALLNGATLVLQPQLKPTLQEIVDTIDRNRVSVVWFTAGLFNLIVDQHLDRLKGVRHILAGGDVLSVPHVRKALKELGPGVLINGYGPTENTTFTCCHSIDEDARIRSGVPIGKPLMHTSVFVLDEKLQPVAIGEPGELFTGGDGLALGYWRRPELTSERFVPDPRTPGAMLYRTGDLVRWAQDGCIEFIGRADGQVKVRGFRIEPGEIEALLSTHPQVKDRIVVARDDRGGEKQLVAYVVPSGELDAAAADGLILELRELLRSRLPEHMVPSAFALLPQLPLTANGKIDRDALPAPQMRTQHIAAQYTPPRTDVEEMLCSVWARVLAVERVGIHDNFFDLGGHSLLGIQLLAEIEERSGHQSISLKDLVSAPTVAGLASLIDHQDTPQGEWTNLTVIQGRGRRMPFFCVHGDEVNHFLPRYLGNDQPYYGFAHQGEDGRPIRYTSVEDIAAHFIKEMRSVRPKGPYLLGGYSFGGIVAFEMATQLAAAGDAVPLLLLFDTYAPFTHGAAMAEDQATLRPLKELVLRSAVQVLHALGRPLPAKLRHFHIIDTYDRATMAYKPKPYSGPITVLRAEHAWGPEDKGWGALAHGPLIVRNIPGDHFSMVKEPAVNTLVEIAAERLDKAMALQAVEAV